MQLFKNSITEPQAEKTSSERDASVQDEDMKISAWKPSVRVWLLFSVLCTITLAAALDATSLSVALPTIARVLHGTAIESFWAGTSFLLTSTVFQPLFASLSTIFGRRALILVALVLFTLGAILGAVAKDFGLLLAGRSIQGIGGGGIIALTEIVITDLVPLRERGKYFGMFSMMWAIGSVTGPIMGGGFAEEGAWRWILWVNLPFCALGLVGVPVFMRLNRGGEMDMWSRLGRVDWIGAFLFIASTTAVLIPISWGGVMYAWSHWRTIVPLVLGFTGLMAFSFWEIYGTSAPMINPSVFLNRTAAANYFGTVMHGIILWSLLYYLPLYFEAVKGMGPVMAGVAIFPQTFTVAPASVAVGILVTWSGRFRWALWAGWTFTALGMGLMYLINAHTPTWKWILIDLVGGLGTGMLFPSMGFAVQAAASDENMTIAVAMFSFLRAFGQTFGIAIGGVIFQNSLRDKMAAVDGLSELAGAYAKDAVAVVEVIKTMDDSVMKDKLVEAYAGALANVWISMLAFAVLGGLTSLWTAGLDLNRELVTDQGMREEKKSEKTADA
ncbi:major facilitator superfamily domain-containing protein [Geopyxis carbonaria]|nr:major facilitator superfamily domain-containing protein [Geopyxis carbonaria]